VEKGINVVLKDNSSAGLARGEQQINNNLMQRVKRKSLSSFDKDIINSRLTGITSADPFGAKHLGKVDMVIEAVFEDLKVKHKARSLSLSVFPIVSRYPN